MRCCKMLVLSKQKTWCDPIWDVVHQVFSLFNTNISQHLIKGHIRSFVCFTLTSHNISYRVTSGLMRCCEMLVLGKQKTWCDLIWDAVRCQYNTNKRPDVTLYEMLWDVSVKQTFVLYWHLTTSHIGSHQIFCLFYTDISQHPI
jgi:hypothetical protein